MKELNPTVSHKQYLILALPLILSGISTPILGAVDTAVVGRMPDPSYIGGVAIGALIFNIMYWLLGFLRVSTTGFTAQAQGAEATSEIALSFFRPMIIALGIGLLFIILQYPILHTALYFIGASDAVSGHAATYFSIRIWGAPLTLITYVMVGWLMGLGFVKGCLAIQLLMNGLNIVLDLVFVLGFGFGVAGVAYATLISEASAVALGIMLLVRTKLLDVSVLRVKLLLESAILAKMLQNNRDLFLRTACLLTMTAMFMSLGAGMGEVTLAANTILLQIHYMMAYLFGGLANASSILVGRAIGGRNIALYRRTFRLSATWGGGTATLLALFMLLFGDSVISAFTTLPDVRATATEYLVWMLLFPFVGFWALQLEGIFFGATAAKLVRNAIFYSLLVFLLAVWLLVPSYANTGVWIAFTLFSLARTVFLSLHVPQLTRTTFKEEQIERMERNA